MFSRSRSLLHAVNEGYRLLHLCLCHPFASAVEGKSGFAIEMAYITPLKLYRMGLSHL